MNDFETFMVVKIQSTHTHNYIASPREVLIVNKADVEVYVIRDKMRM